MFIYTLCGCPDKKVLQNKDRSFSFSSALENLMERDNLIRISTSIYFILIFCLSFFLSFFVYSYTRRTKKTKTKKEEEEEEGKEGKKRTSETIPLQSLVFLSSSGQTQNQIRDQREMPSKLAWVGKGGKHLNS